LWWGLTHKREKRKPKRSCWSQKNKLSRGYSPTSTKNNGVGGIGLQMDKNNRSRQTFTGVQFRPTEKVLGGGRGGFLVVLKRGTLHLKGCGGVFPQITTLPSKKKKRERGVGYTGGLENT